MKKILKWFVITFLALFIGATAVSYFYMNTIVKSQIEKFGSESMNAKVAVGSVRVSLFPIGITLKKLSIDKDDKNDPLKHFYADKIEVSVDHNSLTTDVPVINYIRVNAPEVTYDLGILGTLGMAVTAAKEGTSNFFGAISDSFKSLIGSKEEEQPKKAKKSSGSTKKFIIKKININDAKFTPTANQALPNNLKEISLPDIELEYVNETSGDHILKNVGMAMQKAAVKKLTTLE